MTNTQMGATVAAPGRDVTIEDLIDPPEPIVAAGLDGIVIPRVAGGPPYGLLTSAPVILDETQRNPHWEAGIGWTEEPNTGLGAFGTLEGCDPNPGLRASANTASADEFVPFGIWAAERCSTLNLATDVDARVRRQLDRLTTMLIEKEFWAGARAQSSGFPNAYLIKSPNELNSGTATDPVTALAALEDKIGDIISGPAMIHVTPALATFWFHHQMLRREGKLLLTALDTLVVPGSGYPGTLNGASPSEPASASWAFATPIVEVRLGPVQTYPLATMSTNVNASLATRMAAVTFDLVDAGVPIGIQVSHCSANQACPA